MYNENWDKFQILRSIEFNLVSQNVDLTFLLLSALVEATFREFIENIQGHSTELQSMRECQPKNAKLFPTRCRHNNEIMIWILKKLVSVFFFFRLFFEYREISVDMIGIYCFKISFRTGGRGRQNVILIIDFRKTNIMYQRPSRHKLQLKRSILKSTS